MLDFTWRYIGVRAKLIVVSFLFYEPFPNDFTDLTMVSEDIDDHGDPDDPDDLVIVTLLM